MASSTRVTPRAVNSPVSTGCFQLVGTKRHGGEVVDLVGPDFVQDVDERELVEQVGLVQRRCGRRRWSMRSKFSVLERRTMPWTS